jgi:hypothetical protein
LDPEVTNIVKALEAGGPYAFVAVALIGLVRLYRDLKALNEQVVKLTEQQTAVMVRVEGALMALRDAILCMSGQPVRGPATRIADRDEPSE